MCKAHGRWPPRGRQRPEPGRLRVPRSSGLCLWGYKEPRSHGCGLGNRVVIRLHKEDVDWKSWGQVSSVRCVTTGLGWREGCFVGFGTEALGASSSRPGHHLAVNSLGEEGVVCPPSECCRVERGQRWNGGTPAYSMCFSSLGVPVCALYMRSMRLSTPAVHSSLLCVLVTLRALLHPPAISPGSLLEMQVIRAHLTLPSAWSIDTEPSGDCFAWQSARSPFVELLCQSRKSRGLVSSAVYSVGSHCFSKFSQNCRP